MTIDPWIGKDASEKGLFGLRTLIVGESHYGDPRGDDTRLVVEEHIRDGRHGRFFNAVKQISCGTRPAPPRAQFWSEVAFANFASEVLPERTGFRSLDPSKLSASVDRIKFIIAEFSPELILVFSAASWNHFPLEIDSEGSGDIEGVQDLYVYKRLNSASVVATKINHPSRPGAPFAVWQVWVDRARAEAEKIAKL